MPAGRPESRHAGGVQPPALTLIVDVANVVGSRPDGWWRDRVGATTRLLEALARLPGRQLDGPGGAITVGRVVAVTEGAARRAGDVPGIETVRAVGSGDDAVVERTVVDPDVLVVTADRGLRTRLAPGVRVAGPGWLLALLE